MANFTGICPVPGCGGHVGYSEQKWNVSVVDDCKSVTNDCKVVTYMCDRCWYWWSEICDILR